MPITKKIGIVVGVILIAALLILTLCYTYSGASRAFSLRKTILLATDIFSRKATVLATAESQTGERFIIAQYWLHEDLSYTTQLEQFSPDGTLRIAVIDGDDVEQSPCSVQVVEAEKKLIIRLTDGSSPIEYRWDQKWFVLPPGRERVRD
jgi:hypothetical protein